MAKVVKIKSALKSNKNQSLLIAVGSLLVSVIFVACGLYLLFENDFGTVLPIVLFVLAAGLVLLCLVFKNKYEILNAGVRGEKATLEILKRLPKDYTVITNPVLYNKSAELELDFVVVGKNGVFIVEAKNLNGVLKGNADDNQWLQIKYGKNGKTYEKQVGNPLKQAQRQSKRVAELLRKAHISADVYSLVYFADTRTELKITDFSQTKAAVFSNAERLAGFITSARGKHSLNSGEQAKIIKLFKN